MIERPSIDKHTPTIQTWESAIVVPLSQNLLGGIAACLFCLILSWSWDQANGYTTNWDATLKWTAALGALVATGATVVRFFSDDIGLIAGAYNQGRNSRDAEVTALHAELAAWEAAYSQHSENGVAPAASDKAALFKTWAKKDAMLMIDTYFATNATPTRQAMKAKGVGQRRFERASRLLKSLNLMDDESITATDRKAAHKAIHERISLDISRGSAFVPDWI